MKWAYLVMAIWNGYFAVSAIFGFIVLAPVHVVSGFSTGIMLSMFIREVLK